MTPIRRGTLIALMAALAFGVTAPLVKDVGRSLGAFTTAALLYLGAMLVSVPSLRHRASEEAPVRASDASRLIAVALFGAVLAPAALAWSLQHTTATTVSLLLNFEALFTVLLARLIYAERIGWRVGCAVVLGVVGGSVLVLTPANSAFGLSIGALVALLAALGWAIDNTFGRALAERNPSQVVFWKSALGVCLALPVAAISREPTPTFAAGLLIVIIGATGFGVSLQLYLRAQRRIGAARTASVFAVGPFIGALAALALGEPSPGPLAWAAGLLFVGSVYLHFTEQHRHGHRHEAVEHEHSHRHDDPHHAHEHLPPVAGAHSHWHRHDVIEHDHEHAPDVHHLHRHTP